MRFTAVSVVAALAAGASAATINVLVGFNATLAFEPPVVSANVGDEVLFTFVAKNHSVTQSTFANPCTPMAGGMDSGFNMITGTEAALPQWGFTVTNATAPLWFFCAQTNPKNHCQSGMVFAVNPNAAKNFDTYKATAMGQAPPTTAGNTNTTPGAAPGSASTLSMSAAAIVGSAGLLAGMFLW